MSENQTSNHTAIPNEHEGPDERAAKSWSASTARVSTDRPRSVKAMFITLAVALALLALGTSMPTALADHMGNHERPVEESTSDCGAASSEAGSADASTQTQLAVQGGAVSAGSNASNADDEVEPARPFDGRPW
jgi:hypothetical protein